MVCNARPVKVGHPSFATVPINRLNNLFVKLYVKGLTTMIKITAENSVMYHFCRSAGEPDIYIIYKYNILKIQI